MVIIRAAYVSGYTEKKDTESRCKDANIRKHTPIKGAKEIK